MNCPEVVEWMHRYLDYDLSQKETADMFEHIAVCAECADTFRVLKLLSRELEALPIVVPKYSLVDAIMPQLDALDRARKEKSASLDNIPAEMTPTPIPQLKDRRRRFMGSTAGRALIGVVAAGVILGVAILDYSPEQLSDAQVEMSEATSSSNAMETGGNTTATQGASEAFPKETNSGEQDSATSSIMSENATETEEVPAASDTAESDQPKPEIDTEVSVIQPDKQNPTIQDNKQDAANLNSRDLTSSNEATDSSLNGSQNVASNDASNNGSAVSGNNDPRLGEVADVNDAAKEGPVPNPKKTDPVQDLFSSRMASEPLDDQDTSVNNTSAYSVWSSPNNKYLAVLEGAKLSINPLPIVGSEAQIEAIQTIDLVGTWISGEWSSDSLIFTYQLDHEGKVAEYTYHVNSATVKSP
ncbi:anti-sigma factor RsiW [Paenibacillus sp. DS2015]|uniref:anti-sigma factor family protein n=1 Tax=Paenibacillus sp. DS2015 TaxID=3373917 RepID=UPI003D231EB3